MSKVTDFETIKQKIGEVLGTRTNVNYDELNAYILTLLQYRIRVRHSDGDRVHEVVGVGPKGVFCKYGNSLTVYTEYPSTLSYKPNEHRKSNVSELWAEIGNTCYYLFDAPAKITRPAKKNCSFGATLKALTINESIDDFEF